MSKSQFEEALLAHKSLIMGWIQESGAWKSIPEPLVPVYVSTTSIRFSGIDLTSIFPKGTRIKFTQTVIKYFYVVSAVYSGGNTTLTLFAGSDFSVSNAVITNFNYSHGLAYGFPEYFNYSPTWLSSGTQPNIGNGTIAGRCNLIGRKCSMAVKLNAGSTTTYGSGNYSIGLPINANPFGQQGAWFGIAHIRDTTVNSYPCIVHLEPNINADRTTYIIITTVPNNTLNWTPTAPFTFGNGDFFWMNLSYEIY